MFPLGALIGPRSSCSVPDGVRRRARRAYTRWYMTRITTSPAFPRRVGIERPAIRRTLRVNLRCDHPVRASARWRGHLAVVVASLRCGYAVFAKAVPRARRHRIRTPSRSASIRPSPPCSPCDIGVYLTVLGRSRLRPGPFERSGRNSDGGVKKPAGRATDSAHGRSASILGTRQPKGGAKMPRPWPTRASIYAHPVRVEPEGVPIIICTRCHSFTA